MTAALTFATPDLADLLKRRDLTVDDVAHLPEDLHYELIDGRLVLSPSAMPLHNWIGQRVATACEVNQPPGVIISTDQSVMLDSHNERRPDVVAIFDEGAGVSPVLVTDVLFAFEIISPSSKSVDRKDKRKVYATARISRYWVIDPLAERVSLTGFVLGPDGQYRQTVHTDEPLTIEEPWKITLDPSAWTDRRDRLERARRDR
ncbi:Uma2 family endonuclease [Actinoplanes couchii]|nr:Uma2 family endonuclease [Actinoplanes couchii]MDR6325573.1 Uma2 family endonuclease [Actinoplanes couchii]